MAKQNIYDDETFFKDYQNHRDSEINFNTCIETPILLAMLPDMHGKNVLDIGCGMGHHAKQYADMGAASVLGTDISEKMLGYAKAHNSAENITYRHLPMEDISTLDRQFDLITSSLVFDYTEDFDKLMRDIFLLLKDDGELVYSMSHPMVTAWDGTYDRYTRTETGERLFANIHRYMVEGCRKVKWVVDEVEIYHKTVSALINSMIRAGFIIEECQEARVSDELREKYPDVFGGTIHRPEFIFFRCKKQI